MSNIWISVHSSGWTVMWHGKNFIIGHYAQTYKLFPPYLFSYLPHFEAPLASCILYPFQWPWLGALKSVQSKSSWLQFLGQFLSGRNLIGCWKQFKLNILILSVSEIYSIKRNDCRFTYSIKTKLALACNWMFRNRFGSNLVQWWII